MSVFNTDLVSIIVPVFNASRFLEDTYETFINQTYENWEVIFVDDGSTDDSVEIIHSIIGRDKRFRLYGLPSNSGAANARNRGISEARGRFIAFNDADDLWESKKLEKQVRFMKINECAFSFTGYEFATETGLPNGKKVYVPNEITYKQALRNTTISTITVMFDMAKLTKYEIFMPDVASEDTACWWKVLKITGKAYGLNEILSYYRRTQGTNSANKIVAVRRTWNLYRNTENLGVIDSAYYFSGYAINAVKRRT